MIPCEIDLISTPFCDTNILAYKIELPISGKKISFDLLDDEDFTPPYVIDKFLKSTTGYQLPTQANKMCGSLPSM